MALATALLVLLPAALALWLAATDGGLRTLLHWAAPALRAELARGSLLGGVTLDGLVVDGGGLHLQAERLSVGWRPRELLAGRLHLTAVTASGMNVSWHDEGSAGDGSPLALPLEVIVDQLTLERLALDLDGQPLAAHRLELAAHAAGQAVTLDRWSLDAEGLSLSGQGGVTLAPTLALAQTLRWAVTPPGYARLAGRARLDGDLARLTVELKAQEPQPFTLQLTVKDAAAALHWQATVAGDEIDPARFAPGLPTLPLTLAATLAGDLEHLRIGQLNAHHAGGARLAVKGEIAAPWGDPRLDLQGNWKMLGWPLQGPAEWQSEQGQVGFRGTVEDYRLELSGDARGEQLPAGQWRLRGGGDGNGIAFEEVQGTILGGEVSGSTTVHWSPRVTWQAALQGKGLDPAGQWPRWPGRLATTARAAGDGGDFTLQLERLDGTLRGYPLHAAATLKQAGDRLTLDHARLTAGDNRLTLDGVLAPTPELAWSLAAPHLEALLPDAAGALDGAGTLAGSALQPRINGRLTGDRLRYGERHADHLELKANLDPSAAESSRLRLALTGIAAPDLPFRTLEIDGDGRPDDHRLTLRADGEARARLTLAGGLHGERWQGRVEGAEWDHPASGRWRQEAPAKLQLGNDGQRLAPLCLSGAGHLCLEGERPAAGPGRLIAELADLPARLPLKPLEIEADATLAGRLELNERGDGTFHLSTTAGTLKREEPGLPAVVVQHDAGRLDARLDGGRIAAETTLGLGDLGGVAGRLTVGAAPQRPLGGRLDLTLSRLDWLTALLPQLAAVDGHADARVELGGTLNQPRIDGTAQLEAASAELPEQGIHLTAVTLRAEGDGRGPLRLSGAATSGDGNLQLAGRIQLEAPWRGELTVRGQGFEAIDTAEARVILDPDLRLTLQPDRLLVSGRLTIPEARISPANLQGTVGASDDVEIVGRPTTKKGPRIDSDLTVELGERVHLTAAGFDGRLQGKVHWWEQGNDPPRAEGELNTAEAAYRLYGQKLTVASGRLRFTGGPADNPELDLTATRKTGDVTAGAHVRGPLSDPRLTLFSDPAMNQSDTLSYLLFGRPGSGLSGAEGELLLNAAASLVGGGGDGPVHAVGQALGLDEARIRDDGGLQDSALVLGKYLSPRLYVGYAAGLFKPSGTVELRYRLGKRWELKSESGTAGSGADLLFTLER
ncbi:translocation/assembly module TamB domain-containing protein [Endothiovibrio diazotrophicus]